MPKKKKNLVQIIRDNPGCIAIIDNDAWQLSRESRDKNPHLAEEEKGYSKSADDWDKANTLATSRDEFVWPKGADFGSCCYGGDILQALAIISGIILESV